MRALENKGKSFFYWSVEKDTILKAFMGIKSLADGKAKAEAYRKLVL